MQRVESGEKARLGRLLKEGSRSWVFSGGGEQELGSSPWAHILERLNGARAGGEQNRGQAFRQGWLAALSAASGHRAQGGGAGGGGGLAEAPPSLSHLLGKGGD